MLNLKSATDARWLTQVDNDLAAVLVDHAHCEKKAAGTAMNLIFAYGSGRPDLCRQLSTIVEEELDHFRQVLDLLEARNIAFTSLKPGSYGGKLAELIGKGEPNRGIDRMLIASLIEARSCERFALLAEHVSDLVLAEFYRSLFESEARHHSTYVQMARLFAPENVIRRRLEKLATAEAEIITAGDPLPRMHS